MTSVLCRTAMFQNYGGISIKICRRVLFYDFSKISSIKEEEVLTSKLSTITVVLNYIVNYTNLLIIYVKVLCMIAAKTILLLVFTKLIKRNDSLQRRRAWSSMRVASSP